MSGGVNSDRTEVESRCVPPVQNDLIYLDYQSSKPVDPRVVEAMLPYFTQRFGNASALHGVGDEATEALQSARERVARAFGALPDEVIFTAGATEANNLALLGYCRRNRRKGDHVVITEAEHISIQNLAKQLEKEGFRVSRVPLDAFGRVSPDKLRSRITEDTLLVSVGWASNEIGTIQPIEAIAEMLENTDVALHSDVVAAEGLLPIDLSQVSVGLVSLSSNDIYGPRGVGTLIVRKGISVAPVIIGGGQERGLRSGTEDIASIHGFGVAAEIMAEEMPAEVERVRSMRDRLVERVLAEIPDSHLNGHPSERLANNAHFRFDGVEGEAMVLSLRDAGIAASTGSACSSKTLEPSRTLIACGLLHEEAHGSLEFTFGRFSQEEEVDAVMDRLPSVIARLRVLSPLYPSAG